MTSIDLLLIAFTLGAASNGYRRGVIREGLILAMWLPIYIVAIILVFTTYAPQTAVENNQSLAMNDVLWTLGSIFLLGNVFVYLINKTLIQPWLYQRRLLNTESTLKILGFVLGGFRFVAVFFATLMVYDIFVSPLAFQKLPDSQYIKEAYETSKPVKRWLIEEGYLDVEIQVYEARVEEEKNKKQQLLRGTGFEGILNRD